MAGSLGGWHLSAGGKLALLVAGTVFALYTANLLLLACVNATTVVLIVALTDSSRDILSTVGRFALGVPFLLVFYVASAWTQSPTLSTAVTSGSVAAALFILRIHYVLWVNLYLVRTTEPRDMALALRRFRVPREFCLMIVVILRFFPVMLNEARAVFEAQSARGFELRRMLSPANWLPVAVPLITNVMKRSNDLAIVIELKGGL
jgi:energy-coupling factor transport system permease protein